MARIAFILLCHKDPDAIVAQARQLTAAGDYIAIHFDASAAASDYKIIQEALADNDKVVLPASASNAAGVNGALCKRR